MGPTEVSPYSLRVTLYGIGDILRVDRLLGYSQFGSVLVLAEQQPNNRIYVRNICKMLCMSYRRYGESKGLVTSLTVTDPDTTHITNIEFVERVVALCGGMRVYRVPNLLTRVLTGVAPLIDMAISLCLGGRAVPLSPKSLSMNPAFFTLTWCVWGTKCARELSLSDVGEGDYKTKKLLSFTDALDDIKRLHDLQTWEQRLPRAYRLDKEQPLRVLQKGKVGRITLNNRIVKSATYEGISSIEKLTEFHLGIAKSGVGLTTVAYGAVSPGARSFARQIVVNEDSLERLLNLTRAIHGCGVEGARVSLQLTHAGYFALDPIGPSFPMIGLMNWRLAKFANEEDLKKIVDSFAKAAEIAQRAEFDAVEVHCGHGYLISQFLSPQLNKRKDSYGKHRSTFLGCVWW